MELIFKKLTPVQRQAILSANHSNDYCFKANARTKASLCEKGLARSTSGFGHKFGVIAELTELGRAVREELMKNTISFDNHVFKLPPSATLEKQSQSGILCLFIDFKYQKEFDELVKNIKKTVPKKSLESTTFADCYLFWNDGVLPDNIKISLQ